jgi:hypothetical protein
VPRFRPGPNPWYASRMQRRCTAYMLVGCFACRPSANTPAESAQTPEMCRTNHINLVHLLESLPEKGLAVRGRADLPAATLGGVIGRGRVVDIADGAILLDGEAIEAATGEERLKALGERLADGAEPTPGAPGVPRPLVYLAVAANTDVRTLRAYLAVIPRAFDVHLVFQAPPTSTRPAQENASVSERLLSESDLPTRHALARDAYYHLAECPELRQAVDSVGAGDPVERWPALRSALLDALPKCDCNDLDTDQLRQLLMAEQRAGAAAVGSVPLDFMRDERCGASLGLTPVQKVVQDIEAFDEQFAGDYRAASLDFEQVVTNERLLNYLCPALPGETLAALQRARHTVYWKLRGVPSCQAWQFEPLAPGSPMGNWRRQGADNAQPLVVHYWQGAEEIRLYGPVTDTASKPTDERSWACNQEFRMRGIDADSIALEAGRWFFSESACQKASDDQAAFPGCIAALAGGPREVPPAVPATFPAIGDGEPEAAELGAAEPEPRAPEASGP